MWLKRSSLLFLCIGVSGFAEQKTPNSKAPNGSVNYPSSFQVEGGANLFLCGEYLYWIAHEDGLYYAHTGKGKGTAVASPAGAKNFKGTLKKVEPEWNSGLRLGLGFNFLHSGYDLAAYWTWFETENSDSVSKHHGSLFSIWAHPDAPSTSTDIFAKGKWGLNLRQADLEWGRSSWFGCNFSLRPFFGLRGLWLDQELKNKYIYFTSPRIRGNVQAESDFRGGGLRAGANARFAMGCGFSIYGIASGSLLYGHFDSDFHLKEKEKTIAFSEDSFWRGISSLQLALGLSWDTHFSRDRRHIEFHVGWEQNQWFGANQMNHFMQEVGKGVYHQENSNLAFQGLVTGGRFNF